MTDMLAVSGVTAGYTDVPLLEDVSLRLQENEIVALLGANGAGKSTLLRVLSGLLPQWQGTVSMAGELLDGLPAHERVRRGLAMVPPGRALFRGISVRDNLRLGCYLNWSKQEIEARMQEVVSLFPEVEKVMNQLAGKCSGGEQQMVSIGRALMSRPRVLMVDELSLGLAPVVVERLLPAIEAVRRDLGISVIFVEQDVVRAMELADRAYVLANGRVVLEGKPREVAQDRRTIAAYLGLSTSG